MTRNLTRTSFYLGLLNLAVKPVSMVKEILIASSFGTSAAMDSFFIALGIPALLIALLGSPVASSFAPQFIRDRTTGGGNHLYAQVLGWMLSVGAVVAVVVALLRGPLAAAAAPGLSVDNQRVVAHVLLILSPYLFLQVVAEFQRSVLISVRRFYQAAAWPVLLPTATMASLFLVGVSLPALSGGMAVGAGLVAICTTVGLRQAGVSGVARPEWNPAIRSMGKQVSILMFSSILLQLNLFVDRMMGSSLPGGSVAALNYSYRLLMLMQMVLVTPFNDILLTYFSEHIARGKGRELVRMTNRAARSAILALLPICVFGVVFAYDAVSFVYERGQFTTASTRATAAAFAAYIPTVLILGSTLALPRYFNASRRNRFMMLQTSISLVLNVVLNYVLMQRWGHVGIAMATSITILVGRVILFFRMRHHVADHGRLQGVRHLGTIAIGLVVLFLVDRFRGILPVPGGHLFLHLVLGALFTMVVYLGFIVILRRSDLNELWVAIRRRS